jgi:hypothetical protein
MSNFTLVDLRDVSTTYHVGENSSPRLKPPVHATVGLRRPSQGNAV